MKMMFGRRFITVVGDREEQNREEGQRTGPKVVGRKEKRKCWE